MRLSEMMLSLVALNDSKMDTCWTFMPPKEKQCMPGISNLLAIKLIVGSGKNLSFNFSLFCHQFVQCQPTNLVNFFLLLKKPMNNYSSILCSSFYPSCCLLFCSFTTFFLAVGIHIYSDPRYLCCS